MGDIKAGVIVATEFCRPGAKEYQGYIDYINREEAVRNENTGKYNLYQEYMGNPKKTTGLFTENKDLLTQKEKEELKEIFTTAQENGSVMWQTVISFDNRWLKQHGIINEDDTLIDEAKLKEVARGGVRRMLEAEGLENAVWSGAIHFNTDNLHIHIATVEPIPMREQKLYVQYDEVYNEGKKYKFPILDESGEPVKKMEYKGRFKQSSIEKCKSYVVNELVNDKENNIKINNIIRESIVRQKQEHPLSADADFIKKFEELYQKMPDVNRNLWNYNNSIMAPLRQTIDEISQMYIDKYHIEDFQELKERVAAQEEIYKEAYGNSGKDYASGKMKDLYTRLGNTILKEIRNYDKELNNLEKTQGVINDPLEENGENRLGVRNAPLEKNGENELGVRNDPLNEKSDFLEDLEDFIEEPEAVIDDFIEPEVDVESSFYKWSDDFKTAKKLIHQKKSDYETAIKLLNQEHSRGNILATYELGDIYKYGRGKTINVDTAKKYYERALEGFEYQLTNLDPKGKMSPEALERKSSYLMYRVGKMYYYGLGTEQDYREAGNLFSAASDNQYAKYMLGKMQYYGQGMEKNLDGAFEDFVSISEQNAYAAYKAASMIESGEVAEQIEEEYNKEELYDQAFIGFLDMEEKQEDDNLEYRIGMMYLSGKGVDKDREKAIEYLEKSAEAKNVFAMNKIAQIYLEDNNEEKIPVAMKYLHSAATKGKNAMAMYTLGNVYSCESYGMKNMDEAVKWYSKAEENGNEFAAYKLGKIYLENGEIGNAIKHLEKCKNKYAWYNLGKIYLNETMEQYNPQKGLWYMEQSAEEGNVFAQYRAGKEYYSGEKIEQDIDKAIHWFLEAARQDNEYAAYTLGVIYLDKEIEKYYDPEKGMEYMEQSAEKGNEFAQYRIGKEYYLGENVGKDIDKAVYWFSEAVQQGNQYAMYNLGVIHLDKELGKYYEPEKGMEYLQQSAEKGNVFAQYRIGREYYLGTNVEKDIQQAIHWLDKAVEQQSEHAAYTLGVIYLDNDLEEYYDPEKGMKYLEQAAEKGNMFAQYRAGKEYYSGERIEQDIDKAIHWLGKASEQENEYASYTLGKIYYDQKSYEKAESEFLKCSDENILPYSEYYLGKIYLDKDGGMYAPDKGVTYLEQSAEHGNTTAAVSLGILYLKGESVKQNKVLGRAWIERAANEGDEFATKFLEQMNSKGYYHQTNFRIGQMRAIILCNATQFLKKALKDEWQKRQNEREHEMLVSQQEEKE